MRCLCHNPLKKNSCPLLAALATVSSVTANYKCSLNTATVSWMSVFGATSYSVKAIGDDGDELTCTSEGSSCQISGMGCGQSYVVHVTPMSLNCRDTESTTTTFHTGENNPTGCCSINLSYKY